MLSTAQNTQRDSQSYAEKRRGRKETEVSRGIKGGIKRRESKLTSSHFSKKGVCQGCILSPCLFHLHAEYIMQNARLDEAQAGIKIAGRNLNTLRYADDTNIIAETEEN